MREFFDSQVDTMLALIDAQLRRLEIHHPSENVVSFDCIVMYYSETDL